MALSFINLQHWFARYRQPEHLKPLLQGTDWLFPMRGLTGRDQSD
jgi:hypothetical protein